MRNSQNTSQSFRSFKFDSLCDLFVEVEPKYLDYVSKENLMVNNQEFIVSNDNWYRCDINVRYNFSFPIKLHPI